MLLRWLAILSLGLFVQSLYAQPTTTPAETVPATQAQPTVAAPSREEQLRTLLDTIQEVENDRADLNRQLKRTPAPAEAQQLNEQVAQITGRLKELQASFEEIATGGSSSTELQQKTEAAFNWQQEIEDVIRPLLDELKRLTERPRTIERLRSERTLYENRLQTTDEAIAHIEHTLATVKEPSVKKALQTTLEQWQDHREEADSRLQRINAQLERLTAPNERSNQRLTLTLQEFASGRGLNLVLAIGGFILTYLLLSGFGLLAGRLTGRGRQRKTRRLARVTALAFKTLTLVLAFFVSTFILYARGDWLLLGLLILLAIGILWGLRQSLPRYMAEIRILLDMGSVREGERIVYAGVPWRITSLNVYSTLHNPLLRGGTCVYRSTGWSICSRVLMRRRNPGFPAGRTTSSFWTATSTARCWYKPPRWCSYRSLERSRPLRSPIISARTRAIYRWKALRYPSSSGWTTLIKAKS
jgi:predicted  nucleic acid-binding Zn-ribbon protein